MSEISIKSILWKKVMDATVDTLTGTSSGQYHIELGRGAGIESFFDGCLKENSNSNGGFEIRLPLHKVDCDSPVDESTISVKYMGPTSSRKTWIISSQRPTTAYPLWKKNRAFPNGISGTNYVVIARDENDNFHARWVRDDEIDYLPKTLSDLFRGKDFDVAYDLSKDITYKAKEIIKAIKEKTNVLLYGPPGTGKTHVMQEVISNFDSEDLTIDTSKERMPFVSQSNIGSAVRSEFVTFHQSYSYEDFVIGMRPDSTSTKLLSLTPVAGVLLRLSEYSRNTRNPSLLVIDEINRGNVSRVFGEFITLMEPNKRLELDGSFSKSTIALNLPHINESHNVTTSVDGVSYQIKNPYTIPKQLFTLASMNSVDKSVAPLDAALRRRFHIINLEPDLEQIIAEFDKYKSEVPEIEEVKSLAVNMLIYLNNAIAFFRGKDFLLGQWYLSSLCERIEKVEIAEAIFADIWYHKILPQLEELFHGRTEQLIKILKLMENQLQITELPVTVVSPDAELEQYGASPYIEVKKIKDSDLCLFVSSLTKSE